MIPQLLRGRQVWDSQAAYEANHYPLLPLKKEHWECPACKRKGGGGTLGQHTPHPKPSVHVECVFTREAGPGSANGSGHRPGAGPWEQSWMIGGPTGCLLSVHRASGTGGGG